MRVPSRENSTVGLGIAASDDVGGGTTSNAPAVISSTDSLIHNERDLTA